MEFVLLIVAGLVAVVAAMSAAVAHWVGRGSRRGLEQRMAALEQQVRALQGDSATPATPATQRALQPTHASAFAAPAPASAFAAPAPMHPTLLHDAIPASASTPSPAPPAAPRSAAQPVAASALAESAAAPLPVRKGGRGAGSAVPPLPPRTQGASRDGEPPRWLAWLLGGNTLARIGVLILFIGVGFLVKYASEHVRVPVELRLAGVALGAIALLVVGWRLRLARPGYAMILQGGGVGVLYLTVFGAMRLYALMTPGLAFALLVAIAGLSAWLAVRQDAIAMAAIGIAGGFLAPILASSGSGNHVVLFGYYALLNAAILAIAWFKAWRSLNLLGFLFTFVIATAWGVTRYRPEHFASTEPFLVLFFLYYIAIAVLYAQRRSLEVRGYVDATLVFGTPLVSAALQAGLVRPMPYGMAFSALGMAAVYLAVARILYTRRREELRLLVESFLALGVIFASLAIPLALDARWTSAAWAFEGAAMLWVGVRQNRLAVRLFGLLLQLGAGIAFGSGFGMWNATAPAHLWPLLNSDCLGALIVALAGLFSAGLLAHARDALKPLEARLPPLLLAWGSLWWLGAGLREIDRFATPETIAAMRVAFLAVSAALLEIVYRRNDWLGWRVPSTLLLPALLLIAIADSLEPWRLGVAWQAHLLGHGGWIAWPLAVAVIAWQLRAIDAAPPQRPHLAQAVEWAHAALLWLVTLLLAHELAWLGMRVGAGDGVWTLVPWGLVPALALIAIGMRQPPLAWPLPAHRRGYVHIGGVVLALWLAGWSLGANVAGDGDPSPLPYVPLLNPLDLTEAIALAALAGWWLALRRDPIAPAVDARVALAVLALLAFVWIDAIALRTIHFTDDVPYTLHDLWHSRLVQAVLSLLWSLVAMAAMVAGNRLHWRVAWVAGAALLGVVVVKLFMVDLAQVGGVERIVSFIGVGLLLLLIGYLAPVPPRRPENAA